MLCRQKIIIFSIKMYYELLSPSLSFSGFTASTISSLLQRKGTTPLSLTWKVWITTLWWSSSTKTSAPSKRPWAPAFSSTSSSTYLKVRPRPSPAVWEEGRAKVLLIFLCYQSSKLVEKGGWVFLSFPIKAAIPSLGVYG